MFVTLQPVDPRLGVPSRGKVVVINIDHVTKIRFETLAEGHGVTVAHLTLDTGGQVETVYVVGSEMNESMGNERMADFMEIFGATPRAVFSSVKDSSEPR